MTKKEIAASREVKLTLCFLAIASVCALLEIMMDFAGGRDASVYFVIDMITYTLMVAVGIVAIVSACIRGLLNIAIGVLQIVLGAFVITYIIVADALDGMWIVSDAAWMLTGVAFILMGTSYIAKGEKISLIAAVAGSIAFVWLLVFEIYFFHAYDMYEPTWNELVYIVQYLIQLVVWIIADMLMYSKNRKEQLNMQK